MRAGRFLLKVAALGLSRGLQHRGDRCSRLRAQTAISACPEGTRKPPADGVAGGFPVGTECGLPTRCTPSLSRSRYPLNPRMLCCRSGT